MEKIFLFFCDIQGTYSNGTESDKAAFYANLEKLRKSYGADKLVFSFITGDDSKGYLINNINDFKEAEKSDKIIPGMQFYSAGYIDESEKLYLLRTNKSNQIVEYINILKENYEITKVLFADDNINIYSYENIASEFGYDLDLTVIIPGSYYNDISKKMINSTSYGLEGVNACLQAINNPSILEQLDKENYEKKMIKKRLDDELLEKKKIEERKEQEKIENERKEQERKEIEKSSLFNKNLSASDKKISCTDNFESKDNSIVENNDEKLANDLYFNYLINRENKNDFSIGDLKDYYNFLNRSLDSMIDIEINYEKDDYDQSYEEYEEKLYFDYFYYLIYKDAVIKKPEYISWYDEEEFKYAFKQEGDLSSFYSFTEHFYPDIDTELSELLFNNFYDGFVISNDYKEPNTYTTREIKYVLNKVPVVAFLLQYENKIKFNGKTYKTRCRNFRHGDNSSLVVYPSSKQFYCPSCTRNMSLLKYILENELTERNNLLGVFELIDTLIYAFNINEINLREEYNINKELLGRILICLNSDSYKSFIEDEKSYVKTKKIVPKYTR